MGEYIGGSSLYGTWGSLRVPVLTNNEGTPALVFGDHNLEYPAGNYYMKTSEGNGFIRIRSRPFGSPSFSFTEVTPPPPNPDEPDIFQAPGFVEPYTENLVGRAVNTSSSAFNITAQAFEPDGQEAGEGGELPILSVEWFTFLT